MTVLWCWTSKISTKAPPWPDTSTWKSSWIYYRKISFSNTTCAASSALTAGSICISEKSCRVSNKPASSPMTGWKSTSPSLDMCLSPAPPPYGIMWRVTSISPFSSTTLAASRARDQFCWVPGINGIGNWTESGVMGYMELGKRDQFQRYSWCWSWHVCICYWNPQWKSFYSSSGDEYDINMYLIE